jgi:DNA-binding transcriptional MerR regulator
MDNQILLTSGQVLGITGINPMTLYRYVKMYSEFFSPNAQKHTRGRRWTSQDVEIILSIKALHHDRIGAANIKELLAEGWRLPKDSFFGDEALESILEAVAVYADGAEQANKNAKTLTSQLSAYQKVIREDHERVIQMRRELSDLEQQFDELFREVKTKRYSLFGPKPDPMKRH